jgi:isopenicillin N synthase-like dioxygenase
VAPTPAAKTSDAITENNSMSLKRVAFTDLVRGDPKAVDDLLTASKEEGFFYVDVRDFENGRVLQCLDRLYDLAAAIFDVSEDEKSKHDFTRIGRYKTTGYVSSASCRST